MSEVYDKNMVTLRNTSAKALGLMSKLYNLKYFDKTNYENNIQDLKFELTDDEDNDLFKEWQLALYEPSTNTICINANMLDMGIINEEQLCLMLMHELVRMSSTNRKEGAIGFAHEAVPFTYNEGCTQYIALKLYYDELSEEVLNNNSIYPISTRIIKSSVDALGEELIFDGFFEANFKKEVDGFTPKVLDKWIDYVMEIDGSLEEQMERGSQA